MGGLVNVVMGRLLVFPFASVLDDHLMDLCDECQTIS